MKKIILSALVLAFTVSSCCNKSVESDVKVMGSDPDSLRMVVRVPTQVKPEFVGAFKVATEVAAVASLAEDGCMEYKLYQSPTDSTLFFLDEMWVNKYAHRDHMKADHFKTYIQVTADMKDSEQPRAIEEIKICPVTNVNR